MRGPEDLLANYPVYLPHNFMGLEPEFADYRNAVAVVWPVPLERSTSWVPGTVRGPEAIIAASRFAEYYDEELGIEACYRGIHTLPEMDTRQGSIEEVLARLETIAGRLLDDGKFFLALGGEHTLTPPLVAACARRYPSLSVLQLDAHADLRDEYEGSRTSHACTMRRVLEICPAVQVGLRTMALEEAQAAPALPTRLFLARELHRRRTEEWIAEVIESLSDHVYVTFDADALDPALLPATGTPEPGGLLWEETLTLLRAVFERKRVVSADLVELLPLPGQHASDYLCARLAYKIISYHAAFSAARGA